MAELYIIGQIIGAKDFPRKSLFCKWGVQAGGGWKIISGLKEGQTQVDNPGYNSITYWSHPIDIHFATKGVPGWPKIFVQVYHYDEFGRSEVCGYGYALIPTTPGTHNVECPTWKPVGKLYDKFSQYFIGGGPQLRTLDIVYNGLDRYRLSTEPMGVVFMEFNIIQRNFQKENETEVEKASHSQDAPKSTTPPGTTPGGNSIAPLTTESPFPTPEYKKQEVNETCECDLTENTCDINCCCDDDCSASDKAAFSECTFSTKVVKKPFDMCFSRQFLYKNNTKYEVIVEQDGLFCISRDNYPDRLKYLDQPVVKTSNRFVKVWNRKKTYTWMQTPFQLTNYVFNKEEYKFGLPVLLFSNATESIYPFHLPIPVLSNYCKGEKNILYLKNFQSSCLQSRPQTKSQCENSENLSPSRFTKNGVFIITSPMRLNVTNITESPPGAFIQFRPSIIKGGVLFEETTTPKTNTKDGTCQNILSLAEFLIYHDGIKGITHVDCNIYLTDVTMDGKPFRQEFKVTYLWFKNNPAVFKRSGKPGYILGKPLITGSASKRGGSEVPVVFPDGSEEWISFISASSSGFCGERKQVLFRENVILRCKLSFNDELLKSPKTCSALQDKIWESLLNGVQLNETDPNQLKLYISSYGDPNVNFNEWVPLLIEEPMIYDKKKPCDQIISGISLRVMFSYTGSYEYAQAKVIAASLRVHSGALGCQNGVCIMTLTSAVTFSDSSLQAVSRLAPPPFLRIKLPQDFFYPFSSGSVMHVNPRILIFVLVTSFYYFCKQNL